MRTNTFDLITSTASLCIYDLECLKHRLHDAPDWWADFYQEIEEVNAGNVLIAGLGEDGQYRVTVVEEMPACEHEVSANIGCPSGRVFLGPGEDITGGELEPDKRRTTGKILSLASGTYHVRVGLTARNEVTVQLRMTTEPKKNNITEQLLLFKE